MSSGDEIGLRERKKRRTREAVRLAAFELFEEHGYQNTTIEQIARAADVSSRTFFRYFPNKTALLVPDQLMEPIIERFLAAPAELPPIAAYRYGLTQVFGGFASPEWAVAVARQRLLYTLPEAAGVLYDTYVNGIDLITEALAKRLQRSSEDHRLRITAGAMTGVMMAALHGGPKSPESIFEGLEFLDAGLPL